MKKLLTILIILIINNTVYGQVNLVPNPSFEALLDSALCPVCCIDMTPPWQNPTGGSPNFFAECTTLQPDWDVPQNMFGYQWARTGIGYAGFSPLIAKGIFSNDFREYIQVQLTDTLISNKKYYVSFFVNLCDSSDYATDDIGAFFSDTAIHKDIPDYSPFNSFIPQIENQNGNIITDKENWIEISGIYTAHGGEKFITIGNFYDDANTDTLFVGGGSVNNPNPYSYYYIDDVSVTLIPDILPPDTSSTDDIFIPNIFSPNGDGNNDVLYVRSHNLKEMKFCIYNRWGEMVFESKDINTGWDGRYKKGECNTAVYVYYLTGTLRDGKQVFKKGDVSLVR